MLYLVTTCQLLHDGVVLLGGALGLVAAHAGGVRRAGHRPGGRALALRLRQFVDAPLLGRQAGEERRRPGLDVGQLASAPAGLADPVPAEGRPAAPARRAQGEAVAVAPERDRAAGGVDGPDGVVQLVLAQPQLPAYLRGRDPPRELRDAPEFGGGLPVVAPSRVAPGHSSLTSTSTRGLSLSVSTLSGHRGTCPRESSAMTLAATSPSRTNLRAKPTLSASRRMSGS